MTDHPCEGMSERTIEAFEKIATGNPLPSMGISIVKKLTGRGLIERGADKQLTLHSRIFLIPQYFVPIHVHAQWCLWCSEQPNIEDVA